MRGNWVKWNGKLMARPFVDDALQIKGACVECGGLGVVPMEIDEERPDEMVPCWKCREKCRACGAYFRKGTEHLCKVAA